MVHERIGVCSWSLGPRTPAALAAALERLELRSVQLALGPLLDDPGGWGGGVKLLGEHGIEVPSGMIAMAGEDYSTLDSIRRTGGLRPDATWAANRRRAAQAARLAGESGLGLVTFHAGFLPPDRSDPLRPALLERLRVVAGLFAEAGVSVAIETGQETASVLAALLDDLESRGSAIGVNFDPANMILYGMGDPVEAFRTLAPRVRQVHVKDALPAARAGVWGTETPVGQGAVNWDAFFAAATSIGRQVHFMIEREGGGGPERERDIATARDLVARQMACAGGVPSAPRRPAR